MSTPMCSFLPLDPSIHAYTGGLPESQSFAPGPAAFANGPYHGSQQVQQPSRYEPHFMFSNSHMDGAGHGQHTFAIDGPMRKRLVGSPISVRDATRRSSSKSIRRRISRACDQCNQLRTKCDGKTPCAHCVEFSITCEYVRERKKRGKASKKDLAQHVSTDTVAADNESGTTFSPSSQSALETSPKNASAALSTGRTTFPDKKRHRASMSPVHRPARLGATSRTSSIETKTHHASWPMSLDSVPTTSATYPAQYQWPSNVQEPLFTMASDNTWMAPGLVHEPERMLEFPYSDTTMPRSHDYLPHGSSRGSSISGHGRPGGLTAARNKKKASHDSPIAANIFHVSHDAPPSVLMESTGGACPPAWLASPSPVDAVFSANPESLCTFRYPVLQPLLPHLDPLVPPSLACELLESYFSSTTTSHSRPSCPYLPGFVFQKNAFLRSTQPRVSTPALLASMLWIAAQTSDAPFLASHISVRELVCQKLLEITLGLLKKGGDYNSARQSIPPNPIATLSNKRASAESTTVTDQQHRGASMASGTLDDVVTYLHLVSVISATEHKNTSLQWWNAASSLAQDLGLYSEASSHLGLFLGGDQATSSGFDAALYQQGAAKQEDFSLNEHERMEERQRTFWMMHMLDRHLALCTSRPIFFLSKDCENALESVSTSSR